MARKPRVFIENGIYHVYSRGSNRQAIFELDGDRVDFLHCLERAVARYRLACLGYCLMTNHYHLIFRTPDARLSTAMRELNGGYSRRFNLRYGREAHLFKNRFGAVLQETQEQFLRTVRYVARNPIEKGLCARAEEWRWSSHRALAGLDAMPRFLHADELLLHLTDESGDAMACYRALVRA